MTTVSLLNQMTSDGQVAKDEGFSPVFSLNTGWYPATVVDIRGPIAMKPGNYSAKGSLRLYFEFIVDGTAKLVAQEFGSEPDSDRAWSWYRFGKGYNWGLKENHPPTFGNDGKPAAWTTDPDEIAKFHKAIFPSAEVNNYQTLFGGCQECRAVDYDDAGDARVLWGDIIGSRVSIYIELNEESGRSYVTRIKGASLPDSKQIPDAEDFDYLIGRNASDSSPVVNLRKWPEPKENGNGSSSASGEPEIAPTTVMVSYITATLSMLNDMSGPEVGEDVTATSDSMKEYMRGAIQDACVASQVPATKFTELRDVTLQTKCLISITEELGRKGIPLPVDLSEVGEQWAEFSLSAYQQITGEATAEDMI